jgi:lysophospholipase L1-like esterase
MPMVDAKTTFSDITKEVKKRKKTIDKIHGVRMEVRGYNTKTPRLFAPTPGKRTFNLLAQGDSWFDYPVGTDLIDCLNANHGHKIVNLAVAGSTLNDEAYGPVPREMFRIPGIGPRHSDDPSRIAELVNRILNHSSHHEEKPDALLISAGGNDIAGDEFFSLINNAQSGLPPMNQAVMNGIVSETFKTAFEFMIQHALQAAKSLGIKMPIFLHGYDYPWPDGRGLVHFLGFGIGPWFDGTFNHKNYPNSSPADLQRRYDIVKSFIDALNTMQKSLEPQFPGKVFHVDLRGTLNTKDDWANELHPGNKGFKALAARIDAVLQAKMPPNIGTPYIPPAN